MWCAVLECECDRDHDYCGGVGGDVGSDVGSDDCGWGCGGGGSDGGNGGGGGSRATVKRVSQYCSHATSW